MTNKTQILADLKDLILSCKNKSDVLYSDPEFRSKWLAKNKRLQDAADKLTPKEYKEIEIEYHKWLKQEMPDVKIAPTKNQETT